MKENTLEKAFLGLLNNLRVVIDELGNHGESPHDADVDFHGCVRP